jgi:hypothetical protein
MLLTVSDTLPFTMVAANGVANLSSVDFGNLGVDVLEVLGEVLTEVLEVGVLTDVFEVDTLGSEEMVEVEVSVDALGEVPTDVLVAVLEEEFVEVLGVVVLVEVLGVVVLVEVEEVSTDVLVEVEEVSTDVLVEVEEVSTDVLVEVEEVSTDVLVEVLGSVTGISNADILLIKINENSTIITN